MFTYNSKDYELGEKLTIFAARNGFGKTRISRLLKESLNEKTKLEDKYIPLSYDATESELNPIYFSFDELEFSENKVEFHFLDGIYETIKEKFENIKANVNGVHKMTGIESNKLKKVLSFRYMSTFRRSFKTFRSISGMENKIIEMYDSGKLISTIFKILSDNNLEIEIPGWYNQEFDDIPSRYRDFLYLNGEFYKNEYFIKISERFINSEGDYNQDLYDKITSELPIEKSQRVLTGMLLYSFLVEETYSVISIMSKKSMLYTMNVISMDEQIEDTSNSLCVDMVNNWEMFELPGDLSIESKDGEFMLSRDFKTLSKSEKYRIAFNAIYSLVSKVNDGNICLILDDPFDSLDQESHTTLIPSIVSISEKISKVIIATHKIDIANKISNYMKQDEMATYIFSDGNIFYLKDPKFVTLKYLVKQNFTGMYPRGMNLILRRFYEGVNEELCAHYNQALYENISLKNSKALGGKIPEISQEVLRKIDLIAEFKFFYAQVIAELIKIKNDSEATYEGGGKINDGSVKTLLNKRNITVMQRFFGRGQIPEKLRDFIDLYYFNRTMVNEVSHRDGIKIANALFLSTDKIKLLRESAQEFLKSQLDL